MASDMIISQRCIVSGRVQGVFYRASTAAKARNLSLNGWVRNLADGRVEVVISGEADSVTDLRNWLHSGPPMARVSGVECESYSGEVPLGFVTD